MIEQRAMVFSVLNLSTVTNIKRDTQSFQSVSLQIILLLLGYHIEMNLLTPDAAVSYTHLDVYKRQIHQWPLFH